MMRKLNAVVVFMVLMIFCSSVTLAQSQTHAQRDSIRKAYCGTWIYTLSYGFENYDLPDGSHMEVIPLSNDVTVTELELYRYGSFTRETNHSEEQYFYFHNIEFGIWRMDGDTLFLKVTDRKYDNTMVFMGQGTVSDYSVQVDEQEEKLFLTSSGYFCNTSDWASNPKYAMYFTKQDE